MDKDIRLPKGWASFKAYNFRDGSEIPNYIRIRLNTIFHVESFTGYPARQKDTQQPMPGSSMVTDGAIVKVLDGSPSGATYCLWNSESEIMELLISLEHSNEPQS